MEPHKHEDWKWFSWKDIVEFNEKNELFYGLADYTNDILSQNKTLIEILEITVWFVYLKYKYYSLINI